jgi:hypothetical protein
MIHAILKYFAAHQRFFEMESANLRDYVDRLELSMDVYYDDTIQIALEGIDALSARYETDYRAGNAGEIIGEFIQMNQIRTYISCILIL